MDWLTQLLSGLGGSGGGMSPTGGVPYGTDMGAPPPTQQVGPTAPTPMMSPTGGVPFQQPPIPSPQPMMPPSPGVPYTTQEPPNGGIVPSTTPLDANGRPVPSLGASLEPRATGSPAGLPVQAGESESTMPPGARPASGLASVAAPMGTSIGDRIAATLRGVQAPPPRDVVKPSTPAAPQMKSIQAGQLFALLDQLSNPAYTQMTPQRSTTLGGAVGTGRY